MQVQFEIFVQKMKQMKTNDKVKYREVEIKVTESNKIDLLEEA